MKTSQSFRIYFTIKSDKEKDGKAPLYVVITWTFRTYVTPYSVAKLTTCLLAKRCSKCIDSMTKYTYFAFFPINTPIQNSLSAAY
jgi:hypothetical protein